MKLQEDELSEDTCATTFPTSAQGCLETEEDNEERCSGTEEPFNTIRGGSRHGHVSVPWYDFGNYYGDTGDIWSLNYAAKTPRQSSNAFVTEDAEEECFRALRGHFQRRFGTGRPFGRRFSFFASSSRPAEIFLIVETPRCSLGIVGSPHRGCQRTHYQQVYMQLGS
ncbi:hypothetical protein MRX96_007991 [Rhipicephalus microplus]